MDKPIAFWPKISPVFGLDDFKQLNLNQKTARTKSS